MLPVLPAQHQSYFTIESCSIIKVISGLEHTSQKGREKSGLNKIDGWGWKILIQALSAGHWFEEGKKDHMLGERKRNKELLRNSKETIKETNSGVQKRKLAKELEQKFPCVLRKPQEQKTALTDNVPQKKHSNSSSKTLPCCDCSSSSSRTRRGACIHCIWFNNVKNK